MSGYNAQKAKNVCETKLDIQFRKAKEFNGWYILEGKKTARVTIPKGRKSIPPKTFKSMAKQLKISVKEFSDLLACPLSGEDYKQILVSKD